MKGPTAKEHIYERIPLRQLMRITHDNTCEHMWIKLIEHEYMWIHTNISEYMLIRENTRENIKRMRIHEDMCEDICEYMYKHEHTH